MHVVAKMSVFFQLRCPPKQLPNAAYQFPTNNFCTFFPSVFMNHIYIHRLCLSSVHWPVKRSTYNKNQSVHFGPQPEKVCHHCFNSSKNAINCFKEDSIDKPIVGP